MSTNFSLKAASEKAAELKDKIIAHEKKYYVENDPQISDLEFDLLIKELQAIEKEFPELLTPQSPTQRVGEQPIEGFVSVGHRIPMLSLDNCYKKSELFEYEERIKKIVQNKNIEYTAELKIDGLGISILYRNGKYTQALTRGDGSRGDDVTANVKTIKSLPLLIDYSGELEVRGEIFLPFTSFKTINEERQTRGEPLFANPRNAAAGSLRLLDPKEVNSRKLDIFLYSIFLNGKENKTQWENLSKLKELGFKTNPASRICNSNKDILLYYEKWTKQRENLDYDVDGIVIKVNSTEMQKTLGATAKFPRWAISYKFPARQATTRIQKIIIQVGRTGALTPVAFLDPVKLSGITISRSTLHNEYEIKRKDVRIGDYVLVERSGDVIPKVVSVLKERRTGEEKKFSFPEKCPVCNSSTFKPEDEKISRCTNPSCPAKLRESLLHYSSRRAMNIEGMGGAIVDQLLERRLVKKIPDIYSLELNVLAGLERMGEKSAKNLLDEIEGSKKSDLSRFIFALGIRYVGERTSRALADHFNDLETLAGSHFEELIQIEDVGDKVADSVIFFFQQPENIALTQKIKETGLVFSPRGTGEKKTSLLAGNIFVLTGKLSSLSREEAKNKIEDNGGIVTSSVSRKTNYVVAGESPGSKKQMAQDLEIPIINEEEFLTLIK